MASSLRISSPQHERPYQAAKWLKYPALLDGDEMGALMEALGDFSIFSIAGVVPVGEGEVSHARFLSVYQQYVETLKQGHVPEEHPLRPFFSSVWTVSHDHLYAVEVSPQQHILKLCKPVIQLQMHRFSYSESDRRFHSMVFGAAGASVLWGIQFSYPQLFDNPENRQIEKVMTSPFPNTPLFKKLQKWMREYTVPTPFAVKGEVAYAPFRIGKRCFAWIHSHPQLKEKGLYVKH